MSTLTKLALGMMGQLRPRPAKGESASSITLPPSRKQGGMPLMEALEGRRSSREFARDPLSEALGLTHDQQVLLSQTVGYPRVVK